MWAVDLRPTRAEPVAAAVAGRDVGLAALRGVAFERAELLAYVASMWPWIADDPDAGRWAGKFLEAPAALPSV